MNILALDLGTKMGYASNYAGSGTMDWSTKRTDSPGMRYLRFRQWLKATHENDNLNLVVYEEVKRHMGSQAAHVYGAFEGEVLAFCAEYDILHTTYPVGTIKKHATGKGNAGKEQMIEAAEAKFGPVKDDNHADALWILDLAVKEYD